MHSPVNVYFEIMTIDTERLFCDRMRLSFYVVTIIMAFL